MGRIKENELKKALQAQRLHRIRNEYDLTNSSIAKGSGVDPKNLSKILQGKRSVTDSLARSINNQISPGDKEIYEYLTGASASVEGIQPTIPALNEAEKRDRLFIDYLQAAGHKIYFVVSVPGIPGNNEKYCLSPSLITCLHHSLFDSDLYEVRIADIVEEVEVIGVIVDDKEISLSGFWNMVDRAQVMADSVLFPFPGIL